MNNTTDHRIQALQAQLPADAVVIISDPESVEYFTDFHTLVPTEREAFACISQTDAVLLHAAFSPVPYYTKKNKLRTLTGTSPDALSNTVRQFATTGSRKVLVQKHSLFVSEFEALARIDSVEIASLDQKLIWSLRMHKSDSEKAAMAMAGKITAEAFATVTALLKPGITENEVRKQLEQAMRQQDAELAFPTIVAFGPHTALPHHQPTDTQLTNNTPVLIDLGARYQGYCADMTRSWWFGDEPDKKYQKIQQTVDEAYAAAIAELKSALSNEQQDHTVADLDQAARNCIEDADFNQYFIHTTGHGLGLAIHEQPSIHSQNFTKISPDMVFTIEPGIYLPGKFGYRYENTVMIENGKVVELTN